MGASSPASPPAGHSGWVGFESHPFERAGRAAEPAGEGQEAPSASSRELTSLGGVQARRGAKLVVGGALATAARAESGKPTANRVVGASEQARERARVEARVAAEERVLVGSPAPVCVLVGGYREWLEAELAGAAPNGLRRAEVERGRLFERRSLGGQVHEAAVLVRAPDPPVDGEAELAGAGGDRAGASAGKHIGGDGRAGEAASVRLPEQEILAGKPPQAALGVVEAEGAGAQAHALGRAAELGRERVEVAAVEPSPAQGIVLERAVAPARGHGGEAELPPSSSHRLGGPPDPRRELGGGDARGGRRADERVLGRRPGSRPATRGDAEGAPAGIDRVLRAAQARRDLPPRDPGAV